MFKFSIFNSNTFFPRGNVLLLALLMLAGGMVGTLALTSIVTSQLRQSRVIDAGMIAHYEAESALEEGLYSARKLEEIDIASAPDCSANATTGDLGCTTVNFRQEFAGSADVLVSSLKTDETFELDVSESSIIGLTLEWYPAHDYNFGPQLAITYVNNENGVPTITRPVNGVSGAPFNCVSSDPDTICENPSSALDLENNTEKVRFRALSPQSVAALDGGDIKNLKIRPVCLAGVSPCVFNKYVKLKTRGKKGDVGYTVQVSIPTSVPAYGIADYVLFSEQEVKK